MNLIFEQTKVINFFEKATDFGDIYLMIRVLKKCYDFSKGNSILLVPFKESSKKGNSSIYNTVIENDKYWES